MFKISVPKLIIPASVLFTALFSYPMMSIARNDMVSIHVEGEYDTISKDEILSKVNEIRTEAHSNTSLEFQGPGGTLYKPSENDLVLVQWSFDLESKTLQQAESGTVTDTDTSVDWPSGVPMISGLCHRGILEHLDEIRGEALDTINSGKEYSFEDIENYYCLIHPDYKYTAASAFKNYSSSKNGSSYGNYYYYVQALSKETPSSTEKITLPQNAIPIVSVPRNIINETYLDVPDKMSVEQTHPIRFCVTTSEESSQKESTGFFPGSDYEVDNPGVAEIDASGILLALSVGDVTITGRSGGFTATKTIRIVRPIERIVISANKNRLNVGEELQLTAQVFPENATPQTVVWRSSDTAIASIDETGLMHALAAGSVNISATTEDRSVTTSIHMEVISTQPESTGVSAPVLSLLTQGDIYEGDPVTIRFDAVEGAVAYRYEIDGAGNDYTPTEPRQAYGLRFPSLSPGTHSIRMKAVFRDGSETDFSQPLPVTVKSNSVSGPVLTLLTSDPIYEDTGFDIRWTEVPNASYYVYNFEKASRNSTVGGSLSPSGNALTHHFNGLPAGAGLYTLRIRAALNADGSIMSEYSNAVHVEIHSRPANAASAPVVTIRSTSTLTTDVGVPFSFTPVANAESYLIQIVTSDEKKELVYNSSVPNAGSYRLGPDKYEFKAGAYVMTITARLRDGSLSPESDGTYFWIVNPITEDGPTLRMQTQGTLREDTGFELAWTAVPNAFQYVIYTYDKATGHTESYHRVDGSNTTLKIDRHKAGTYRAYVYAMLDALGTTLSKNSNTIEFTVSERSSVSNNTSNTITSQNTVSDPPKSVDNTPAPVAVSTVTTTPATMNYMTLAATSEGSNAVQENAGETQNATRAGVMTHDKKQVVFFVFLLVFSLLMLRREMYQLQLAKLYHVLSYQLTAYQKRHDNKHSNK